MDTFISIGLYCIIILTYILTVYYVGIFIFHSSISRRRVKIFLQPKHSFIFCLFGKLNFILLKNLPLKYSWLSNKSFILYNSARMRKSQEPITVKTEKYLIYISIIVIKFYHVLDFTLQIKYDKI